MRAWAGSGRTDVSQVWRRQVERHMPSITMYHSATISRGGDSMKKLINDPYAAVDEMLDGCVAAHGRLVRRLEQGKGRAIVRADAPVANKVGLVIGGGSGHKPAFVGYVGKGAADA